MADPFFVVAIDGLLVGGVQTGLRLELMPPAFLGALWSLRRSPEAGPVDKFLRVLTSTAFGVWGGWPLALAMTTAVPHNLHKYAEIFATLSPYSIQYLTGGLIGYVGFAMVDRWLFPVRAAHEKGDQ